MKNKLLIGCLIILFSSELVLAGDGFYNPWLFYGWGCYYQPSTYSQESVPYFALHPPVYYSHPIPRTYGDSPFPYPPGLSAYLAHSTSARHQIVKNTYTEEENTPSDQQYQTHTPLRISNPFVEQSSTTSMSKGVKWEAGNKPKPLVIVPASLARQNK